MVWDPETGTEVGPRINVDGGFALGVAWSPTAAARRRHGQQPAAPLRNRRRAPEIGEPIESIDSEMLTVAFSPDGTKLAAGNLAGVVQQWSVDTHEPVGPPLKGHSGPVGGVTYSPDGLRLAASTIGFGRSRLWDAETGAAIGQELVTGRTPSTYATYLIEHYQGSRPAFAPDGRSLAVPSYDGTTAIWDLEPDHWLDAACDLVGRNLTRDEWEQYLGRFDYRETCP